MKLIAIMLCVLLFTAGCTPTQQEQSNLSPAASEYPAAVMVEGVVYVLGDPIPAEVHESAIIGYTDSYTNSLPQQDGQTNFSREPGLPYARVADGIVILYEHEWHRCEVLVEEEGQG